MSSAATAWVMTYSRADPIDRMVFLALTECSGSGDSSSGVLRDYRAATGFTGMDLGAIRSAVARIVALGELKINELADGAISWAIPVMPVAARPRHIPDEVKAPSPGEVVYVIGSTVNRRVKIGRSVNVAARLRSIQNMSPAPLTVLWTTPGGRELESQLHAEFADYRVHGEWFDFGAVDPVELIKEAVGDR